MSKKRKPPANAPGTTTVRVTLETREAIQQLAAMMTIDTGKKVEMGQAIAEAVRRLMAEY